MMSDQGMEMQFAEPDWRPGSSQALPSPGEDSSRRVDQKERTHRRRTTSKRLENRRERQAVTSVARLALLVIWVAATPLITRAFQGGWIVPLLGILFLPLTTLTYTIIFAIIGGVTGLAWLWIIGALLLDLMSYGGSSSKGKSASRREK